MHVRVGMSTELATMTLMHGSLPSPLIKKRGLLHGFVASNNSGANVAAEFALRPSFHLGVGLRSRPLTVHAS